MGERLAIQRYHGATSPLKHTRGVDRVLKHWIRRKSKNEIPLDLFLLILNFLSNFDAFEFQQNHYWTTRQFKSIQGRQYQAVYKNQGMGCYHNILFGAILTGDIEFECKVIFSSYDGYILTKPYEAFDDNKVAMDEHDTQFRDRLSVGLVEPDYHQYLEQNMHTKSKNKRCIFRKDSYFDCNGKEHNYYDDRMNALREKIQFDLCVNMKKHTFCITDSDGHSQTIMDIPDQRVICFEVWDCKKIYVYDQKLKWV